MWATADEVERCGVEVQSATEHFSRHTAAGKLTFNVLASIAQFGSDQLSEVMKTRLAFKAEHGNWVGPLPYGYRRDGKTLAPADEASIVALIFEWYATGVESYTSIADRLNTLGYRTYDWQTGRRDLFGRESVRVILQNRAYCGYVSSGGVEHRGNHPALVSEELWERCAAVREARTRQGVFKIHPDGGEVLTRRVFCAECGSPMYRNHSGRSTSRTVRYRCGGPRAAGAQHRDCDAPMALAAPIEDGVIDLLCRLRISPELRASLEAEARSYLAQERPRLATRDIDRALRELKQRFLDEAISALEYEAQRAALLATPMVSAPAEQPLDLHTLLMYLADLPSVLRAATPDEARAIVAPVLSHVWVKDRGLHAITPTPAFEPLLVGVWRTEVCWFD